MPIYKGNENITPLYFGEKEIATVYRGDTLVYDSGGTPVSTFIYTVDANTTIGLPVYPLSTVRVDWGDGITETLSVWNSPHVYKTAGEYTVRITGKVTQVQVFNTKGYLCLTGVLPFEGDHIELTNLHSCFSYCRGLQMIPTGLFDSCMNVTNFNYCFYYCEGLTSLPVGLFNSCVNVVSFLSCFYGCTELTSIPVGLFDNCTNTPDFVACFYRCTGLTSIPAGLFDNCPNVTSFSYCFYRCTGLKGITPKTAGIELWERAGKTGYPSSIKGEGCFTDCTGLTNYSSIPDDWKS